MEYPRSLKHFEANATKNTDETVSQKSWSKSLNLNVELNSFPI